MNEHDDMSESNSGFWRILNRQFVIPNWLATLAIVLAIVIAAGTAWKRNADLRSRWAAPDRPKIQSLEDTRKQMAVEMKHNFEMGVVRLSQTMLKMSDENSPARAAYLNSLANAYVVDGEHEKAAPLHQESRELLEKFLGADHPDVAIVDENARQSRVDQSGPNEPISEPRDDPKSRSRATWK